MNVTTSDLVTLIDQTRASRGHVTFAPFATTADERVNEYLLFLKPEVTQSSERLGRAWDVIADVLEGFDERITAVGAAHSSYLARHRLIEAHYGVINQISSRGVDAMSTAAREKLEQLQQAVGGNVPVVGGHQFLERYVDWSAEDLAKLYDSLDNVKFGSGMYGVVAEPEGERLIILNGFHPQQLAYFYEGDKVIVLFTVQSRHRWSDIRRQIAGATDPERALEGSIRARLLAIQEQLGYDVATARNGVHVSAGPIEAAVEISRYMSDFDSGERIDAAEVHAVRRLEQSFDTEFIRRVLDNAVLVTNSKRSPAFDVTEEVDSWALEDALRKWRLAER